MQMMVGTGEIFSFLQTASATGAIISTVATLSTKAETMPANRLITTVIQRTFFVLPIRISLSRFGMPDPMKSQTVPIVPTIIMITFQSISESASGKV